MIKSSLNNNIKSSIPSISSIIKIIQVYAPITTKTDNEIAEFTYKLNKL